METKFSMVHSAIKHYLQNWDTNSDRTEKQKELYPCKRFTLRQLGNEPASKRMDSIRLVGMDGWDGQYIGSVSATTASEYGWHKDYQVHPKTRDLIRFGLFFHLGPERTLILVLKSDCEKYLCQALMEESTAAELSPLDLIENLSVKDSRLVSFARDIDARIVWNALYTQFAEQQSFAGAASYDEQRFEALAKEIVTHKVQAYALNSAYTEQFLKNHQTECTVLKKKQKAIQEEYYRLKREWTEQQNSLDCLLLQQSNIMERNSTLRTEWMKTFGDMEIEMQTLQFRQEELTFQINIKEVNPEKPYAEVMQMVQEHIRKRRDTFEEEKRQIEWLLTTARMIDQRDVISSLLVGKFPIGQQIEYMNQMEKMKHDLLHDIYFRTHPDATARESFTDEQRETLLALFDQSRQLKKQNQFSTAQLVLLIEDILEKVNRIWDHIGIDVHAYDLTVIDEEPEAMIDKLKLKIDSLLEEDAKLRNEIFLLLNDAEMNEYEAILSSSEETRLRSEEYQAKIQALREEVAGLEKASRELFGGGAHDGTDRA